MPAEGKNNIAKMKKAPMPESILTIPAFGEDVKMYRIDFLTS